MKRFERRRVERLRRVALVIGLSFALGALIDTALTWRLHEFDLPGSDTAPIAASVDAAPIAQPIAQPAATPAPRRAAEPAVVPTTGSVAGGEGVAEGDVEGLRERRLEMPVDGVKPSALHDTYSDSRALGRPHEAIDIMAAKGTPVHAVEDGNVAKLFTSVAGGLTIYQFDPSGEFAYYYAHLDSYADDVREGRPVKRGQVIGYVGSTGNASEEAPHLHFAIFRLTPEHKWWKGEAINPYPVLR